MGKKFSGRNGIALELKDQKAQAQGSVWNFPESSGLRDLGFSYLRTVAASSLPVVLIGSGLKEISEIFFKEAKAERKC